MYVLIYVPSEFDQRTKVLYYSRSEKKLQSKIEKLEDLRLHLYHHYDRINRLKNIRLSNGTISKGELFHWDDFHEKQRLCRGRFFVKKIGKKL